MLGVRPLHIVKTKPHPVQVISLNRYGRVGQLQSIGHVWPRWFDQWFCGHIPLLVFLSWHSNHEFQSQYEKYFIVYAEQMMMVYSVKTIMVYTYETIKRDVKVEPVFMASIQLKN